MTNKTPAGPHDLGREIRRLTSTDAFKTDTTERIAQLESELAEPTLSTRKRRQIERMLKSIRRPLALASK